MEAVTEINFATKQEAQSHDEYDIGEAESSYRCMLLRCQGLNLIRLFLQLLILIEPNENRMA